MKDKYSELRKLIEWQPGRECIGRYIKEIDCDWASYGLFRGPVIVIASDTGEEVPYFDFAGNPFSK